MRRFALFGMALALLLCMTGIPALADAPAKGLSAEPGQVGRMLADLAPDAAAKIDPALLKQLGGGASSGARAFRDGTATFLVHLAEQADLGQASGAPSIKSRRAGIVAALQQTAQVSQAPLVELLAQQTEAHHVQRYTSYWIFNGLAVEGDMQAVLALAQRPEVAAIRANRVHYLPILPASADPASFATSVWGLQRIRADQVWRTFGITGEGVVVANMDSGVDWTHPALQHAYRGYNAADPAASLHDYNWYDATGSYPTAPGPNQPHLGSGSDHGTHTMGSIVGSNPDGSQVYGVAPGAQWIAAKIFGNDGSTTDEWLHAGFQWIMAPTDLQGLNPDPSRAPDIVSNSWGNDVGSDRTFARDLTAWHAAGIFSAWAAGNEGPGAGTINSPGSFVGALSVGATDSADQIAYFSSRGPSAWGQIKPEVSAPGVSIASTIAGGGIETNWNGTSMATPHVAGLAALLYQAADHTLSITETQHVITSTVVDLGSPGQDNSFGYGRIDALNAVQSLIESGSLSGTITDAQSGAPVSGAQVVIAAQNGQHVLSSTTDTSGAFTALLPEGLFNVTVSAFGYVPRTTEDVAIAARTATPLDLALEPLPSGEIDLSVTSSADGSPLEAMIYVEETPISKPTGPDGRLTLRLPVGTYALQVVATRAGWRGTSLSGIEVNNDQTTPIAAQLTAAPKILYVDADAWYDGVAAAFYAQSLRDLMLGFDTLAINDRYIDVPSAQMLLPYDIVIWAHAAASPGYISAWQTLGAYLDAGGNLLLSGQDIGYWDVSDNRASSSFAAYLHADYVADDSGGGALTTQLDGLWDGLDLVIGTPDSAGNQAAPDEIIALDPVATTIATYANGADAALAIDACTYRAIYAGFGLEGVGPRDQRALALQAALDWLVESPGVQETLAVLTPSAQSVTLGGSARGELYVYNRSAVTQTFVVAIDTPWATSLTNSSSQPVQTIDLLPPCQGVRLVLEVTAPAEAVLGSTAQVLVQIYPIDNPQAAALTSMTVTTAESWQVGPPLPSSAHLAAVGVDDCRILVAGGKSSDTPSVAATNQLRAMQAADGLWTDLAAMPLAAAQAGGAMAGDAFYVIGGVTVDSGELDAVQIYDTVSDSWSMGPHVPTAIIQPAVAALDGDLYVFAGSSAGETLATALVLESGASQWRTLAPLPAAAQGAQAVALDPYIYVAGGMPQMRQVWRYDPGADAWTSCASMSTGRHSFALASDGRFLYAAGGGQATNGLNRAERYDPASNTWLAFPSLHDAHRLGAAGAMVAGRLYLLGGEDTEATTSVEYLNVSRPLAGSSLIVDRPLVETGQIVTYTLSVHNPSHASHTTSWQLAVPPGIQAVGKELLDVSEQRWQWAGTLPAGTGQSFDMQARVMEGLALNTLITATAVLDAVSCGDALTLQASSMLLEPSAASSTKTVDRASAEAGDTLTYTIRVANTTPFPLNQLVVTDTLPHYTNLVPDSLLGAAWDQSSRTIQWQGSLEMGAGSDILDWRDASVGQILDLGDDDCEGPLDLGFSFTFYGQAYDKIYVNSNGMVLFGGCSTTLSNTDIPDAATPNGFVAPMWDDLNPRAGGAVYFDVQGVAPQRVAVVSWQGVPSYGTSDLQTFQVLLFETSNGVKCQYLDVSGDRGAGSSATVGIEGPDGAQGMAYLYNGAPQSHQLHDGLAILLDQASTAWATEHIIRYATRVDGVVPLGTTLINRAFINDGRQTHTRVATTALTSPQFARSYLQSSAMSVISGQRFELTAHVFNTGDAGSDDVEAKVQLSPDVVTLVPGQTLAPGVTVDEAQGIVTWRGALAAGQNGPPIRLLYDVNDDLPVNMFFSPYLTILSHGLYGFTTRLDIEVNTVEIWPSRLVCKPVDLHPGQAVNILIDVRNTGRYTATQASASMILPATLEMVDAMLFGASYDAQARQISWQGTLLPDGLHTIVLQALVAPQALAGSTIPLEVRLEDGYGTSIGREATLNILPGDLGSSWMGITPQMVRAGEAVTVSMYLTSSADPPIAAELVNPVPIGLVVRPDSLSASEGAISLSNASVLWQGAVAPGVPITLSYTADIPTDLAPQTIVNSATLTGGLSETYHLEATVVVAGEYLYLPLISR